MSQQQPTVTAIDLTIAGVIAGGCVWLLGAMFSWTWSVWAYVGLAAFFFLISIGQLAIIRSKLSANKATMEMNQRQQQAQTGTRQAPVGYQQQPPEHQAPPEHRTK